MEGGKEKFFVKAGSRWPFSVIKDRNQALIDYIPFPFYLAYTAALLQKENIDVEVIDAVALNWSHEKFIDHVVSVSPDILLIESTTPTFEIDIQVLRSIRKKTKTVVCIAGSHATSFPDKILTEFPEIDFIFQGEYEFSFLDFVKTFRDAGPEKANFKQQKSIAFNDRGTIFKAEKGLIEDLDLLPYPAWELFPQKGLYTWDYYWDNICQYKPAAQMHSSRGCPFRCDFCVWIQVMYDNSSHRSFSPKRIVDEMLELKKRFNVKEIYFDDDIFTGNRKHVQELCHELLSRDVRMKWSAMGDAMICSKEDVAVMAKAGMIAYKFGVESGDPRVLKEIQKPLKLDKAKELAALFNQYGIKAHATFSFGLSGETQESMENTLKFMKELSVDTLQVSITTPFPGTRFYDKVKLENHLLELNWSDFDGANTSVVSNKNLSNKQIQTFAKHALRSWLRAKVFDFAWVMRQMRFFFIIVKGQGFTGLYRILQAGFRVLLS
jgi:radical SAM superfamily enzyme YgiQ (UPF0313 family)